MLDVETIVTFRKPFADARQERSPETWFAEGVVGMIVRADDFTVPKSPRQSGPGRPARSGMKRVQRYFVMWELPDGGTVTNYLPASAIKVLR